jgi:hypothetical protein
MIWHIIKCRYRLSNYMLIYLMHLSLKTRSRLLLYTCQHQRNPLMRATKWTSDSTEQTFVWIDWSRFKKALHLHWVHWRQDFSTEAERNASAAGRSKGSRTRPDKWWQPANEASSYMRECVVIGCLLAMGCGPWRCVARSVCNGNSERYRTDPGA